MEQSPIFSISSFFVWFIPITVIVVAVFLILRELVLWYWKINQVVSDLDRIADSLERIASKDNNETAVNNKTGSNESKINPYKKTEVLDERLELNKKREMVFSEKN